MSNLTAGLIMIVVGLICLAVFLLPSLIAFKRQHHYKFIILAINLILGVTGVGYLIALIWAVWPKKTAIVDVVTNDLTSAKNNQELYRQRGENARAYDTARYGGNVPQPSTLTPPLAAINVQPPATSQQSPSAEQQFKACPYCGEQIAARAIKCKHCQTMLTAGSATEPAIQHATSIDKSKALEDFVVTFHAAHRQTNPVVKKKAAFLGGTAHSHVYGGTEITDEVLQTHNDHLDGFNPSVEKLLLVINKPSGFGMKGVGGIVLTNHTLYYKLMGGGMVSLKHPTGRVDINSIRSIVIGDSDNAYGGAYNGHELFINGEKVGMLRMGTDMMWDDETLEYTTELFKKLTETLFSR